MSGPIIYEFTRQPPFWIVQDEDGYWLVPAQDGGWDARTPFVGRVGQLRVLADTGAVVLGLPPAPAD